MHAVYGILLATITWVYDIRFSFELNSYQQGCIILIKSDSKDIYDVTNDFYFI